MNTFDDYTSNAFYIIKKSNKCIRYILRWGPNIKNINVENS